MSGDDNRRQPPSPPYSNDGDFGCFPEDLLPYNTYTPPDQIRARSIETYNMPYDEVLSYPPPPQAVYCSPRPESASPQPTFVRNLNCRPTSIGSRTNPKRESRALGSPIRSDVIGQSPRPKKRKADAGRSKTQEILPGPLSEITKDYAVPVKDMEAWVNRPAEERLAEVSRKQGHIARPMNSFMLYRSAYAERVKQYCKENNHQVVSKVTGQSWPMEPKEVREMYERFAVMERDNHQAAHPDYKFTPNKNGKKRSRQDINDDDDTEDDSDGEWGGSRVTKRSRTNRRSEPRSMSSTPFDNTDGRRLTRRYSPPLPHPSSYRATNPYTPIPYSPEPVRYTGHYYEPQLVPYGPNVDDLKFQRAPPAGLPHEPELGLTAMPGARDDLLNIFVDPLAPSQSSEPPVDPELEGPNNVYPYGPLLLPNNMYSMPRSYPHETYPPTEVHGYVQQQQIHPGMIMLTQPPEGWYHTSPPGSEFDDVYQGY